MAAYKTEHYVMDIKGDILEFLNKFAQVAPERVFKHKCSDKSDVYAFGVLLDMIRDVTDLPLENAVKMCMENNEDNRASARDLALLFGSTRYMETKCD